MQIVEAPKEPVETSEDTPNKYEQKLQELQQEYSKYCSENGNIHYRRFADLIIIKENNQKMKKINNRAFEIRQKLQKTKSEVKNETV